MARGLDARTSLEYALDESIDSLTFVPTGSSALMTWEESLWKDYTDGIVILHRRRIVYERYFAALTPDRTHAAMSLTKSVTGTLAAMLAAEGALDRSRKVADYVPELEGSAFGDATVEQVLDMTTSLRYTEHYADRRAEVWQYAAAGSPFPKPAAYEGPVGYFEYLRTLRSSVAHDEVFAYKTPNADVAGWIVSRISGKSVAELLSERIWSRLGMELDAYFQVDAKGAPSTSGGLSAGLRDMARFGELLRNEGM